MRLDRAYRRFANQDILFLEADKKEGSLNAVPEISYKDPLPVTKVILVSKQETRKPQDQGTTSEYDAILRLEKYKLPTRPKVGDKIKSRNLEYSVSKIQDLDRSEHTPEYRMELQKK